MYLKGEMALGESVEITDPCYNKDCWCRTTVNGLKPGKYACWYDMKDLGDWGKRVTEAMISLEGDPVEMYRNKYTWEEQGIIGVDAGLAGFFQNKPDFSDPEWLDFCNRLNQPDEKAWLFEEESWKGFFTSSGFGDGGYPVSVLKNDGGEIIAVKIDFLEEGE